MMENLPDEEGTTEGVRSFSPWRGHRGDLITVFQYLKSCYTEDRDSFLTRSRMKKAKGNGYKFHWETFHCNTRKKKNSVRTIIDWNNLPRHMAESTLLEVFKMLLDRLLDDLI